MSVIHYPIPYPHYDYRVHSNRDRWHPCTKPRTEQCKDHHNQPGDGWERIFIYSQPEMDRQMALREAWYARQRRTP